MIKISEHNVELMCESSLILTEIHKKKLHFKSHAPKMRGNHARTHTQQAFTYGHISIFGNKLRNLSPALP